MTEYSRTIQANSRLGALRGTASASVRQPRLRRLNPPNRRLDANGVRPRQVHSGDAHERRHAAGIAIAVGEKKDVSRHRTGASLSELAGVSSEDATMCRLRDADTRQQTRALSDRKGPARSLPRLSLTPLHAVVAVLLLTVALCASLTMLVQQTVNYAKQSVPGTATVGREASGQQRHGTSSGSSAGRKDAADQSTTSGAHGGNDGEHAAPGDAAPWAAANSPAAAGSESAHTGVPPTGAAREASGLVNLNNADVGQLQRLNGVGPVMAQRIIDYRATIGRFSSVDQLKSVTGIGPKIFDKLRSQVTV